MPTLFDSPRHLRPTSYEEERALKREILKIQEWNAVRQGNARLARKIAKLIKELS